MSSNAFVRIVVAVMLLGTSCSMRVTGVVRDASTGNPIGGAVVTADDGRNRLVTTDPAGRYGVKTHWKNTTMTASAPGYQPKTIAVPGDARFPIVFVDLERISPVATGSAPIQPAEQRSGAVNAAEPRDGGAVVKLRELQDLHDRGLISDEEYKHTRTRIVGEL